jgi:hypothetical protein
MNLEHAALFRILTDFFGSERVIYNMSVASVCSSNSKSIMPLHSRTPCLFTIVDGDDNPKLVIDTLGTDPSIVDVERIETTKVLRDILEEAGIYFVLITPSELQDLLDPLEDLDICKYLSFHIET